MKSVEVYFKRMFMSYQLKCEMSLVIEINKSTFDSNFTQLKYLYCKSIKYSTILFHCDCSTLSCYITPLTFAKIKNTEYVSAYVRIYKRHIQPSFHIIHAKRPTED